MAISLDHLRKLMSTRTLASGDDFDFVFYHAINMVIRDINAYTVKRVQEIDETDPPRSIPLDAKYYGVFLSGARWYMSRFPKWASVADDSTYAEYMRDLGVASSNAIEDEKPPVGWNYNDDNGV